MPAKVLPIAREYAPVGVDDPRRQRTPTGYINANGGREHIIIAVFAFGGPLPSGYEVHHVNELKDDNRPTNLVICETRRLHHLLHAVPELLEQCEWLQEPGKSVRIFRAFDPPGTYFCVRCKASRPLNTFARSAKYASGVRGECSGCRSKQAKISLRELRKTHPVEHHRKGGLPGRRNPAAKLAEPDVLEIRKLYAKGARQVELAESFGVTQSTISLIVLRKKWRHVP